MKTAALLAAIGIAALAFELATGGHPLARWTVGQLALAAAVIGCLQATAAFGRGDYMWRAWAFTAAGFLVGFVTNLLAGPGDAWIAGRPWGTAVNVTSAVLLNGTMLVGAWLFALAYFRGGLSARVERPAHAILYVGTAVLTLVLGVPPLAQAVRSLRQDDPVRGALDVLSVGTDMLCFVAGAPLLRVALDLAGSALARVWWLVGIANLVWLLSDGLVAFTAYAPPWRQAAHALLAVACVATFLAARRHARAVRETLRVQARAA